MTSVVKVLQRMRTSQWETDVHNFLGHRMNHSFGLENFVQEKSYAPIK
jgi:hypothetical protein